MSESRISRLFALFLVLLLPLRAAADEFPLPPIPDTEESVPSVPTPGPGLPAGTPYPVFAPGQVLTAAQLNAALAAPSIIGGTINGAPIGDLNPQTGRFSTLRSIGAFQQDAGTTLIAGNGTFQVGDNTARKRTFFNSWMSPNSGVMEPVFKVQGNAFGAVTSPAILNTLRSFTVNSDAVTGAHLVGHYFQHTISAGSTHGRNAMQVLLHHEGTSTMNAGQYYVALAAWAQSLAPAGGTSGTKMGNLFGSNISALLRTGAGLYWNQVVGLEINSGTQTGTAVLDKVGLQIVQWATDAVPATRTEAGLLFAAQTADQVTGWKNAIQIGANHGSWPIHPSGTLIGLGEQNKTLPARYPMVVANGLDLATAPLKITGAAIATPGFRVGGSGQVTLGSNTIGWSSAGLALGAAGKVGALSTIAAGGSGYRATDIVLDANGGVWEVATVSSGAITGLTLVKAPTLTSGSAPSNPLALSGGMGNGATINVTWTNATTVAVNGTLNVGGGAFTVNPSNGSLSIGGGYFTVDGTTGETLMFGGVTASGTVKGGAIDTSAGGSYRVNGTQVLGPRITGWDAPTGTATRTSFNTATVTLQQLAERVKALVDDTMTHGSIGN